jgi:Spy/CpxP family protein refolding chaperone
VCSRIVVACALAAALCLPGTLGFAADAAHQRPWPIYDWRNHQPTQGELNALHEQDVTPDEAKEVDELHNQLESSSERILRQEPALEQ